MTAASVVKRQQRRTSTCVRWVLLWVAAIFLSGPLALASEASERGAVTLGVQAGGRTFDGMSVGEVRPQSRGEVTGAVELGYAVSRYWDVSASWRFGGSWFDFTDGSGATGNIKDDSWTLRGFADRKLRLSGGRALRFGLGYEYGEARSWLETAVFHDEGPHAFTSGGAFRVGVDQTWGTRVELRADLEQSIYRAHSTDASFVNTYNWLGRASSATIGVRFILFRGREEPDR